MANEREEAEIAGIVAQTRLTNAQAAELERAERIFAAATPLKCCSKNELYGPVRLELLPDWDPEFCKLNYHQITGSPEAQKTYVEAGKKWGAKNVPLRLVNCELELTHFEKDFPSLHWQTPHFSFSVLEEECGIWLEHVTELMWDKFRVPGLIRLSVVGFVRLAP